MNKMKKRISSVMMAVMLVGVVLMGCGKQTQVQSEVSDVIAQTQTSESIVTEDTVVRIGALKGPTTLGLLFLQDKVQKQESSLSCEISMMTAADELLPLMVKGELDIALLPANVASVLNQKTNGGISVININTLGVLYMVSGDDTIQSVSDLKGKTIYLTGKGTTPDYVLHYILSQNGLKEEDYTLSYKSEATEIVALLAEDASAIGLLPQPFVTVACAQNAALQTVLDLNAEWDAIPKEQNSSMVTGVTVVRNAFLQEHKELVDQFIVEHQESVEKMNEELEEGARLAVEAGIIGKEPIAQKAIPLCNITCLTGEQMQTALLGYLNVLFEQNPESVGGALPTEAFYYIP